MYGWGSCDPGSNPGAPINFYQYLINKGLFDPVVDFGIAPEAESASKVDAKIHYRV